MNLAKKERKIEQNSLAQHWARDWRTLALTQERKQIMEGGMGNSSQSVECPPSCASMGTLYITTLLILVIRAARDSVRSR